MGRASTGIAPPGTEIFPFKSQNDRPVILEKSKIATGDQVTNAQMGFDQQSGTPQVNVELDSTGARSMQRTWYQCVNGSVGAVPRRTSRCEPGKLQSNHNAIPWIWVMPPRVKLNGISKRWIASIDMDVKSNALETAGQQMVCGATGPTTGCE